MRIGLDVRNVKRAIKPSKNDVILFDGKEWYVTTKEDLFKEFEERLSKKEKTLDNKIAEVDALKISVAKQLLNFSEIIEGLITKEDK